MPPGCLRWRISSARRPRSGSGACSNRWTAFSADTRSPARILSVSSGIVVMIETDRSRVVGKAELGGVAVERLQPLEFLTTQDVPDIIAQVSPRDRLTAAVTRVIAVGHVVGMRDPLVACVPQGGGVGRRYRVRPAHPARVDERQACHLPPRFAEIDLPNIYGLMIQQERRVADDEPGIGLREHGVE